MGILDDELESLKLEYELLTLQNEYAGLKAGEEQRAFEEEAQPFAPMDLPDPLVEPAPTSTTAITEQEIGPPIEDETALFGGLQTPEQRVGIEQEDRLADAMRMQREQQQVQDIEAGAGLMDVGGVTQSITPEEQAFLDIHGEMPSNDVLRFLRTMWEQTGFPALGREVSSGMKGMSVEEQEGQRYRFAKQQLEAEREAPPEFEDTFEPAFGATMPGMRTLPDPSRPPPEVDDREFSEQMGDALVGIVESIPEMVEMTIEEGPLWIFGGGLLRGASKIPGISKKVLNQAKSMQAQIDNLSDAEKLKLAQALTKGKATQLGKVGVQPSILAKAAAPLAEAPQAVKTGAQIAGETGVLLGARAVAEGEAPTHIGDGQWSKIYQNYRQNPARSQIQIQWVRGFLLVFHFWFHLY